MRVLLAVALAVTATLFGGCASDSGVKHFYLGSDVYVDSLGIDIDPGARTIKDPKNMTRTKTAGLSRTMLVGWDLLEMKGAPWVACRFGYFMNAGADCGFAICTSDVGDARMDGTLGFDYVVLDDLLFGIHGEQPIKGGPMGLGFGLCQVF
jgi:hypothetical protein